MNKLTTITIITLTLGLSSQSVYADRNEGFLKFLGAVAQAAQAAQSYDRGYEDQGYYDDRAYYDDEAYYPQEAGYGDQAYYDEGPYIVDLRGTWVMDGGNRNRFQQTHEGYYVVPVGRGKGVQYVEIGDNVYQEARGSATYEVIDENYMVWYSNDKRNLAIELYRQ